MNQNKLHIVSRLAVVILTMVLLVPSVVKFSHVLEDHKHEICKGEYQSHLHEVDLDCEFFKFKLNNTVFFEIANFECFQVEHNQEFSPEHYIFLKGHQQRTAYLRGPPALVHLS